jgi:hypothetical protein
LKITIGRRGLDSLDLKIGTLGGFLWTQLLNFVCYKRWDSIW